MAMATATWGDVSRASGAGAAATALLLSVALFAGTAQPTAVNIFHISDLHLDSTYFSGGPADDHCHALPTPRGDSEDIGPLNPAGDFRCDPPPVLVESAFAYMKKVLSKPDLIVWTGDSGPHWKEGPDFDYLFGNLKNISRFFHLYFPDVPVVPVLGNHDTDPPDNYPDFKFDDKAGEFYSRYIEEGSFGDYIKDPSAREEFKKCGYYSVRPLGESSPIRFIVLNTNLYYYNKLLPEEDNVDPCDQVEWLKKELEDVQDGDQVFVAAHIPPGFHERNITVPMFNVDGGDVIAGKFADVFRDPRLAGKIVAHFYGHTHTDSFRLFRDKDYGRVLGVAFVQPSITPALYRHHQAVGINPTVRLYRYGSEEGHILDYQQHYLDLEDAMATMPEDQAEESAIVVGPDGEEEEPKSRRDRNSKLLSHDEDRRSNRDDTDDDHRVGGGETPQGPREVDGEDTNLGEQPASVPSPQPPSSPEEPVNVAGESDGSSEGPPEDSYQKLLKHLVSKWQHYYNAIEAFEEKDLSKKSMGRVYYSMIHDEEDGDVFRRFLKHNTASHFPDGEDMKCGHTCWLNITCGLVSFTKGEVTECLQKEADGEVLFPDGANEAGGKPPGDDEQNGKQEDQPAAAASDKPPSSSNDGEDEWADGAGKSDDAGEKQGDDGDSGGDANDGNDGNDGNDSKGSDAGAGDADPGGSSSVTKVTSVPENHSVRGAAIGFCIVLVLAIAVGGLFIFRKVQRNRYRAQEFLLTDSVFRYDGYSQVEAP